MRGGKTYLTYLKIAEDIKEHKAKWWHRYHIVLWGRYGREKELKARKKDLSKFLNKVGLRGRYKIKLWIPEPKIEGNKSNIFLDEFAKCFEPKEKD